MNRRDFIKAAAVAPVAVPAIVVASQAPSFEMVKGVAGEALLAPATIGKYVRLSVEENDPGFLAYGKLRGDGRWPTVYLDGVKQDGVMTCDSNEGWIKRFVISENGNIAHNGDTMCTEIVHGKVEIDIPDYEPPQERPHAARAPELSSPVVERERDDFDGRGVA